MTSLFISYSRKDIETARKLTQSFDGQGLDFWIDWEGIPPTVDWWKEIERGIERANIFVFLISPDSAKSKVCRQEIEHAAKNGKRLIPIVVRDITAEESPTELRPLNWIFLRENDVFDQSFGKLITAIKTDYEWVQTHSQIQVKALEWERNNHENGFLLHGKELQDAEIQLVANSSKEPHPTDLQREYILKSRQAADRQRRTTTGAAVAGLIIVAALAVYGFIQAGIARGAQITSEANAAEAQTAQVNAENKENARATAQASAEEKANIALAHQIFIQAQSLLDSNIADEKTAVHLLAIQSMKLYPSFEASHLLQRYNPDLETGVRYFKDFGVRSRFGVFSLGGKYVVFNDPNGFQIWDVEELKKRASLTYPPYTKGPYVGSISKDGKYVQSVDCLQRNDFSECIQYNIRVWSVSNGTEIAHITEDGLLGGPILLSPDGRYIASIVCIKSDLEPNGMSPPSTVCHQSDTRIYEMTSSKEIARLSHDDVISAVAISPDGRYVVTGSKAGMVRVVDITSGNELASMKQNDFANGIIHISFSPDGKYIAIGSLVGIVFWESTTRKEIGRFTVHPSRSTAFSLDGKWIASSGDGIVTVLEVATGKEIANLLSKELIYLITFSPDGKFLLEFTNVGINFSVWKPEDQIAIACLSASRNLTYAEWNDYIGDALPFEAVCPNLQIEPVPTPTP